MQHTPVRATELAMPSAADGVRIGAAQRHALLHELERLTPEQWQAPTECPPWTVFDTAAHVVAATENQGAPLRMISDRLFGGLKHRGLSKLDAMNEMGIDRRRGQTPQRLLADFERAIPKGVAPAWLRGAPISDPDLPSYSNGAYMADCILPRDTWLHRHDIARAAGTTVDQEPTDAEVIQQVVRDLALAWQGPDVVLDLTGPEGGRWLLGHDQTAPTATLPTVEFMRLLSGRVVAPKLLDTVPDAVRPALTAARVTF